MKLQSVLSIVSDTTTILIMTVLIALNKVTFLVTTLLMTDFTYKMTLLITVNKTNM
jgi:hypothetical protein